MWPFSRRKPSFVESSWLTAKVSDILKNTPDAATIMRYEIQLVFIYDQMMGGMYEFDRVGNESFFGATAYTAADYVLWKKKLGLKSEAIALQPKSNQRYTIDTPVRIQGEIYGVRPERLMELDKYKENMVQFKRIRARLVIPYRSISWIKDRDAIAYLSGKTEPNSIILTDERVCEVKAWMYVGCPEYWDELLDGGFIFEPVRLYTPKATITKLGIPQYARFTQLEYESQ